MGMVMDTAAMVALARQNRNKNCAAGADQIRIRNSMTCSADDVAAIIVAPNTWPLCAVAKMFVGDRPERVARLDLISCAEHQFPPWIA